VTEPRAREAGTHQVTGHIRPLQRADIPQVASRYEEVVRSGSDTPAPQLGRYSERTLLDHPWTDPEVPSLVYVDDQHGVAAFVGSHVRRMAFDGRPLRAATCGSW